MAFVKQSEMSNLRHSEIVGGDEDADCSGSAIVIERAVDRL